MRGHSTMWLFIYKKYIYLYSVGLNWFLLINVQLSYIVTAHHNGMMRVIVWCVSLIHKIKIRYRIGLWTGGSVQNRFKPVFRGPYKYSEDLEPWTGQITDWVGPGPNVRSILVRSSPVLGPFPVLRTGPQRPIAEECWLTAIACSGCHIRPEHHVSVPILYIAIDGNLRC